MFLFVPQNLRHVLTTLLDWPLSINQSSLVSFGISIHLYIESFPAIKLYVMVSLVFLDMTEHPNKWATMNSFADSENQVNLWILWVNDVRINGYLFQC
jgi:hypothetical protein